ncbi:MAG: GNAT family N-acetyltransferase [Gemmatimonadaceae bacterium]
MISLMLQPSTTPEITYREAISADVPAMERCRDGDTQAGPADARMAAYLDGKHHPQQALPPRTAFVALAGDDVVGYIAGHATERYGCAGEVQYLYVAPGYRRRRVAHNLLRSVARWFQTRDIRRVCVNANIESLAAVAFYAAEGAVPLNKYWYIWEDIGVLLGHND